MKKLLWIFFLVLILPSLVSADSPKKKALYFYSENCSLCDKVDEYLVANYFFDKYEIKKIDVAAPYNLEYLNQFFDVFEVAPEKRGWPAVVLGDEMLVGSQSIETNFFSRMEEGAGESFSTPEEIRGRLENKQKSIRENPSSSGNLSLGVFLGAALLDSFNPCALSTLIILLALMIFVRRKDKALLLGMFFILGIFSVYLLIGLSAFWFLPWMLGVSKFISLGAASILMLVGLIKLMKIFGLNRYFSFQKKWGKLFSIIIKSRSKLMEDRASHPVGSLILGALTSFFLLPCAHKPYLVSANVMLRSSIFSEGRFFLILLYNLIFIIPMIVLVAGIYLGSKNQKFSQWEEKNKKIVDALISGVLIFVGMYLIQNWI